jgi:adenylate cyclase
MASTRRLAAILAADVAGYSRLMGIDEEGTHASFTAHLRELFGPKIRQHRGRIVKSTGDGMLAEFASVVEAVRCAVEIQSGMLRRNDAVAEDRRLNFRIGINVGDVIAEPEDIFGDGVNIAARLEGVAEPNGICVSRAAYDQIRDKLTYPFEDLGPLEVKNIARPVHTFALSPEAIAPLPLSDEVMAGPPAVIAQPASRGYAPRLSSVVLPFANLSDDRADQYLADALTDDVTTDLSRIAGMTVISRNTAFAYRDRRIETPQIGRELNVRYVLSGSVRRAGNRVRVNTQLADTETDAQIWAERFDCETGDLFASQDEITSKIAIALNLELVTAEAVRSAERPDALDSILRGRAALYNYRGSSPEGFTDAINLFERALDVDAGSVEARALLALALAARVLEQATSSSADDITRARELIGVVAAVSPRHPLVNFVMGHVLRAEHQFALAIPEYEAAIATNRNWVIAIAALGLCKFFAGAIEEAIPAQLLAIRLSPRDPRLPNWYWRIGLVHLLQSHIEEAILWLGRARNANPRLAGPHAWLASAHALRDDMEAAAAELEEANRLSGDGRYLSVARFKRAHFPAVSRIQSLYETTFLVGLRKLGVSEM